MSHLIRRLLATSVIAPLFTVGIALAQQKPFPHAAGYVAGFVPTTVKATDARSAYDSWKTHHLQSDCGGGLYRVDNGAGDGSSFSEGLGYGMVLTAYYGDKAEFDGLWKFVQKNLNASGLMGWHVTCGGFTTSDGGSGSATDGDTDIAFALFVAQDQWGSEYRQPALDFLKSLKAHDYTTCSPSGRAMATNGDWDKGCTSENTSYFMPAYYRVFARFAGDPFWSQAADDAVALWKANANPTTGLIANEVDQNGNLGAPPKNYVDYNGCRIPWRASLEYLWHGTAGAKQVTDKITTWASGVGISKLVDGYNTDGTPSASGQYTQLNAWVGGWTSGAMTHSQSTLDGFYADFRAIADDNGSYYGSSLRSLYMLMLSGNQWEPGLTGDAGVPGSGGQGGAPGATGGQGGMPASGGQGAAPSSGGATAMGSGGTTAAGSGGRTGAAASGATSSTASGGAGTSGGTPDGGAGKASSGSSSGCGCTLAASTGGDGSRGLVALSALVALGLVQRRSRGRG